MFKSIPRSIPFLYVVTLSIMAVFFGLAYLRLPPQIPLFYSLPNGTEQVVDTWLIVIIPIIAFICIAINSLYTKKFIEQNEFTDKIVRIANMVVMVASAYIFIKIILLVAL